MSIHDDQDGFELTVSVPALELARLRRRMQFLEAAVAQLLRQNRRLKEWFTAEELAALRLPGLPLAPASITRLARASGWATEKVPGRRGAWQNIYHFSSLPRRSFDAMIDLVIKSPPPAPEEAVPAMPEPPPLDEAPENMAPPWVLPLMRIIKTQRRDIREAVQELPRHLPEGMERPSYAEAVQVLRRLGMA